MQRIKRVKQDKDFTIIPNIVFKCGLSLRAVGLLTSILQLPPDWVLYKTWLYENMKEGRDAIRSAWEELEKAGFIVTIKDKAGKGKLPETHYIVYDLPQKTVDNQQTGTRQPETLQPEIRQPETDPLLSTKGKRTKGQRTNKQSTIPLSDDKGAPSPEAGKSPTLYQRFMDVYDAWYKERNGGVPPKIDGGAGNALKTLIQYFVSIVKARAEKDGHTLDEAGLADKAVEAWGIIFKSWHLLDNFLQDKTRLLDINSNIQNIITKIKKAHEREANGQPADGGKKPTGGDVSNTDLLRKVAGVAAAFSKP
jgi:hypothetical protein